MRLSLTDNLDLSTPAGRLMFQVIAAMGEFERELIRERVRAGLRHARARGRRLGRPKVVADGHQVATLRRAGRSWREICRQTAFPKGQHRGPTASRKAFLACPKTIAALSLRASESSLTPHLISVPYP